MIITSTHFLLIGIVIIVFIVIIGIPGSKIMKAISDYIEDSMYKELSSLFVFSMAIPLLFIGVILTTSLRRNIQKPNWILIIITSTILFFGIKLFLAGLLNLILS